MSSVVSKVEMGVLHFNKPIRQSTRNSGRCDDSEPAGGPHEGLLAWIEANQQHNQFAVYGLSFLLHPPHPFTSCSSSFSKDILCLATITWRWTRTRGHTRHTGQETSRGGDTWNWQTSEYCHRAIKTTTMFCCGTQFAYKSIPLLSSAT